MTGIPAGHPQLLQNREVLLGLGHDAFVRGHDQQGKVDPRSSGDHGAHEVLVAGDVHYSRGHPRTEIERREVEIDRDATTALLGQPVHGLSGERRDERRLSVVDVSGGPDDHTLGGRMSPSITWASALG